MKLLTQVLFLLMIAGCSSNTAAPPAERKTRVEGGYVVTVPNSKEEDILQKQELVRRQGKDIERQKREIEDIHRQEYYNERMRDYSRKTFGTGDDTWTDDGSDDRNRPDADFNEEGSRQFPSDDRY